MNRVKDKIDEINKFLNEFKGIIPKSLEEYESNIEKKAACERYFEKIVEAVTDLAFLIIKNKKFKIPDDDIAAFNILFKNNIIDIDLATKLKKAKGVRNIISHQYCDVDDEIVFESITKDLERDVREFIKHIKKKYQNYGTAQLN